MTDNTPTNKQRILLDVIGNIPPEWDVETTYPTLPEVRHRFDMFPELRLSSPDNAVEIAVRAVITDQQVFHGYTVTTSQPEPAVLTASCRERSLTSLSHRELLAEGIGITHHPDIHPSSDEAAARSLTLSAAVSLAGYYAATVTPDADADHGTRVVPADDD